jgi:UDP-N-acetylmuramate--alanine ligase
VAEGIAVHYHESWEAVPEGVKAEREKTLVIYTPAVPADHAEWVRFRELGYELRKRSEILGMIASNFFNLAVAGTHGKTTSSTMLAHLLHTGGLNTHAFLGGIANNFASNLLLGDVMKEGYLVAEADEYDRSFLRLSPEVAVVTSTEADHLDIYGDAQSVTNTFAEFAGKVKAGGALIAHVATDLPLAEMAAQGIRTFTFGLEAGDYRAERIRQVGDTSVFDFTQYLPNGERLTIRELELKIPGRHNVQNMTGAIAAAMQVGIAPDKIRQACATFRGVKRRFDYIVRNDQFIYIDDYAHHPTEIEAILGAVKAVYPEKKLLAVFQPHLYTRTRDFAEGFAKSLALADSLILLDIYPARELPIEGVSSEMLLERVALTDKALVPDEALLDEIRRRKPELLVTIGAGDIDQFIEPIRQLLEGFS